MTAAEGAPMIDIGGAGPAGLAAAIVLARRGYRVRVLERSRAVGRRFHDDFQGLENWTTTTDVHEELRGFGIEPTWWHRAFHQGDLVDAGLRKARVSSRQPLFYCVRRGPQHPGSLDNALLRQALAAGVEVCFGRKADPGAVQVFAGGPSGRPTAISRGLTFAVDRPDLACQIVSAALTPKGYVYFVVAGGRATLGTVLLQDFGESKARLRMAISAVEQLYEFEVPSDAAEWGGYACFSTPTTCVRDGTLLAGESAGIQDALFGFGIRSALLSGALAATAIAEGSSYDAAWRARLLPLMKASSVNRALWAHLGFAEHALWRTMRWTGDGRGLLRRLYGYSMLHRCAWPWITRVDDERGR